MGTPFRVLFLDKNFPEIFAAIERFAAHVDGADIEVVCLSERQKTSRKNNFQVVSVGDYIHGHDIDFFQRKYNISLYKILVVERSLVNYYSFRRECIYSNETLASFEQKYKAYINAVDDIVSRGIDLFIDSKSDNFVTNLVANVCEHYKTPVVLKMLHYWWNDGCLILDGSAQTSSIIESNYRFYSANPHLIDSDLIVRTYSKKISMWAPRTREGALHGVRSAVKRVGQRIELLQNRQQSYEPLSVRNLIVRRVKSLYMQFCIRNLLRWRTGPDANDRYVLYPLHVMPEASVLGSDPELADQFSLIKNISMNLPWGIFLYVKEHPLQNSVSGYDYQFYKRLSQLPNVKLVDKRAAIEPVLKQENCLAVAVLNGTTAIDAMINNKPAFVFGRNSIFRSCGYFEFPGTFDEFSRTVLKIMAGDYLIDADSRNAYLMALTQSVVRSGFDYSSLKSWDDRVAASYRIDEAIVKRYMNETDRREKECEPNAS
jgi:hypothetical protein